MRLLTLPQMQERLAIGRSTALALLGSGAIPKIKIGKLVRVDEADLEKWIEGLKNGEKTGNENSPQGEHLPEERRPLVCLPESRKRSGRQAKAPHDLCADDGRSASQARSRDEARIGRPVPGLG